MPNLPRTKRADALHGWYGIPLWFGALAALLASSLGHAQTIYRCGNDYTAQAICEQAQPVAAPTAQPSPPNTRQAQAEQQALQKQADALEKQRLQHERAVPPSQPMPLAMPAPHVATPAEPASTTPPHTRKKRGHVTSPYFTAYGAAPAKAAKPAKKAASAP